MAIQKAIRIMCWGIADGTSTSFTLDLTINSYWIGSNRYETGGRITNWYSDAKPYVNGPVGVVMIDGANSASIVGNVITINVPVKPAGTKYEVVLEVLFA